MVSAVPTHTTMRILSTMSVNLSRLVRRAGQRCANAPKTGGGDHQITGDRDLGRRGGFLIYTVLMSPVEPLRVGR